MIRRRKPKRGKRLNFQRWLALFSLIFLFFFAGKVFLSSRKSIWKEGRFNFVFISEPILVFSLSPDEPSLTVVKIPPKTFVEVTHGFGLYRTESIYPLGEIEGKGGQLLAETIQEFLAVPIGGWIRINSKFKIQNSKLDKEEFLDLKAKATTLRIFLSPKSLIKFLKEDIRTNLTFFDLTKIWLMIKGVEEAKINFIDLEGKNLLEEFSLPDGQIGRKANPVLLDKYLQDYFFEKRIRKEKISIEVLNGTDFPGLAQRAARIIGNIGGKVNSVKDSEEKLPNCQIKVGKRFIKSFTTQKLADIFNCQVLKGQVQGLILVVGKDYQEMLFSKSNF